MSLKNERDSTIQKFFARHNLGSVPNPPFSSDAALSLTNRIKSRLMDLEKDLQDKKVNYIFFLIYIHVGTRMHIYIMFMFNWIGWSFFNHSLNYKSLHVTEIHNSNDKRSKF